GEVWVLLRQVRAAGVRPVVGNSPEVCTVKPDGIGLSITRSYNGPGKDFVGQSDAWAKVPPILLDISSRTHVAIVGNNRVTVGEVKVRDPTLKGRGRIADIVVPQPQDGGELWHDMPGVLNIEGIPLLVRRRQAVGINHATETARIAQQEGGYAQPRALHLVASRDALRKAVASANTRVNAPELTLRR